ncbi:MAG: WcaF family extracellular polysaccharide biosynthesis acetyltransferase [Phycisphaerales bacterium]|nr:WcaF family extracellular polysaccharide biosynthesis acetyltransferase [Phycisphaerales bacterium]
MQETTATMAENTTTAPEAGGGESSRVSNVTVVIPAFNEELNLPLALRSVVGWADDVFVVDSQSSDRTREVAKSLGARVVVQPWLGYAKQKNWALQNLPIRSEWVFILDADESITPALRDEILAIAARPVSEVAEGGFYINRLTYFMGKAIRHCGFFPSYNLRFFKAGKARYEDRDVHEHMLVEGETRRLKHLMMHEDRRGLEHFIAKHNRYSTLEARELIRDRALGRANQAKHLERGIAFRRWLKYHVQPKIPLPGLWRFLYMYFFRLGILDGVTGFRFCFFLATYDFFISLKLAELKNMGAHRNAELLTPDVPRGLAVSEGTIGSTTTSERTQIEIRESLLAAQLGQMAPEASPWTLKQKIMRALWMLTGKPLFRFSFHNWYGFRNTLLRLFGAKVGADVRIRPSVHIEIPWHLTIASGATIGDNAILYSLGPITIGARTIISQYAHLCAGTHDYTDRRFPLLRPPITIGEDAWVGADTFVGPGVHVGKLSVLGARSSTYRSLEPGMVYVGNPAKPIKKRELK